MYADGCSPTAIGCQKWSVWAILTARKYVCSVVAGVSLDSDHTPRICGHYTRATDLRTPEEVETLIIQSALHLFEIID